MSHAWTDAEAEKARRDAYGFRRGDLSRLADKLANDLRFPVSVDSLNALFKRRRWGAPSRWCLDGDLGGTAPPAPRPTLPSVGSSAHVPTFGSGEVALYVPLLGAVMNAAELLEDEDVSTSKVERWTPAPEGERVPRVEGGEPVADRVWVDREVERESVAPADGSLERVAFIPDCHFPYEDKAAWALTLRALGRFKPDTIVILGDFVDMYSASAHARDPKRIQNLAWEIEEANRGLDAVDALGARRKLYLEGNHEFRLSRYLADRAPDLVGLAGTTVPELLRLADRHYEFTPYKSAARLGKMWVTHDAGNAGQYAHMKARDAYEACVAIGHVHRAGIHYSGNAKGDRMHFGAAFGWLGSAEAADYLHKIQAQRAWCHAFGIGFMEPSGVIHVQVVPLVGGRCVVNGELVQ